MIECVYCGYMVPDEENVPTPPVDDDAEWVELAKCHAADCEWLLTRAHRLLEVSDADADANSTHILSTSHRGVSGANREG